MYLDMIRNTIKQERDAIQTLLEVVNEQYEVVCKKILECKGKVIFMGVGKSAHIGKKLAATFASTGTPSFFVHATEAMHGDFGMIETEDIVILMSNSGTTNEVTVVIPTLKKIGCSIVGFTSNENSVLAIECDYKLIYPKLEEADHLGLAPTVSSTLMLVLGDAIGCTLSKAKDFNKEDFHLYHPGGSLGKLLKENN